MSPVSEKIEAYFYGGEESRHRETGFKDQLWRGIKINVRNLFKEFLFTILILLSGFIPVINFFTPILLFIVQAYYAGFGNMDYTLERHFNYKKSIHFVSQHRGTAIGNGSIFILLLLVPVLGVILVLPLSVTAASTETLKLLKQDTASLTPKTM